MGGVFCRDQECLHPLSALSLPLHKASLPTPSRGVLPIHMFFFNNDVINRRIIQQIGDPLRSLLDGVAGRACIAAGRVAIGQMHIADKAIGFLPRLFALQSD